MSDFLCQILSCPVDVSDTRQNDHNLGIHDPQGLVTDVLNATELNVLCILSILPFFFFLQITKRKKEVIRFWVYFEGIDNEIV